MKKILYIAIAFLVFGAVSCQKEKDIHPVGSKIVFSAATEHKNGSETRTQYSGDYTANADYERIDWISGDKIKILYSYGQSSSSDAVYAIDATTISGSGTAQKSTANINIDTGISGNNALEWATGGTHVFYGLYPHNGGTLSAGSATGLTIPKSQTVTWNQSQSKYLPDMSKAYMVAYKDMSGSPESSVSLPFTPIMTAVEFKLHLPDDGPSYPVSRVQLKTSSNTDYIAGTFGVNISDDGNGGLQWAVIEDNNNNPVITDTGGNRSNKVTVSFSNGNATLPVHNQNQTYLDFTMFVLPVSIYEPILQIEYADAQNAADRTVKAVTLSGLTLTPGMKYVISNGEAGLDSFIYTVTPNFDNPPLGNTVTGHTAYTWSNIPVTSSRINGADSNAQSEYLDWKVQYYDGTDWNNGVPTGYILSEDHSNNSFTVNLSGSTTTEEEYSGKKMYTAATELLRSRTAASGTIDLSYYNVAGEALGHRTTANCYVITRPGTYRIPLIYGNAIVNDATNAYAYDASSLCAASSTTSGDDDGQNYFLPTFLNGAGDVINDPNIITDLSTLFGSTFTPSSLSATISPLSQKACITNSDLDIVTDNNEKYIQFTISQQNIKPGNIIIHLKGTVGSYFASTQSLWSWHIWVTDKDLRALNGKMPYNLGWIDDDVAASGGVNKYEDRELMLRIVQVEGGTVQNNQVQGGTVVHEGTSFTLKQTGDVSSVPGHPQHGTNTQYQWGRKDPYPSIVSNAQDSNSNTIQLTQWAESYDRTLGIKNPEVMIQSEKSKTWLNGTAVPLYRKTSRTWTIKNGSEHYLYFSAAVKNALTGTSFCPTGTSWESKGYRVTAAGARQGWFNNDALCFLGNCTAAVIYGGLGHPSSHSPGIFSATDFTYEINNNQYIWYFKEGTIISQSTLDIMLARKNAGQLTAACYNAFVSSTTGCLEEVFEFKLGSGVSYPYSGHNDSVKQSLKSSGLFNDSDFDEVPVWGYTLDATRYAGSILYNLWSASLYNEYATVTDKYKTVYDPCPAGYTVPTFGTYYSSGPSAVTGKRQDGISGFSEYPRTGYRDNVDQTIANAQAGVYVGMSLVTTKGLYWTDHPCNMQWRGVNYPDKSSINSYLYYTDAYMLQTDSGSASLQAHARCDVASIRPMVDPRASGDAGSLSRGNVSASNPIEGVSIGSEL